MSESDQLGPLMIGALASIIDYELRRRVDAALRSQGFNDYRSSYGEVFKFLRPDGSRVTELAELAHITRQAMSELVIELERRGYVERAPDPTDRRAILVRRTPRGWQVNAIAFQVVETAQREWAAQLGEEVYTQTLTALRHIVRLIAPSMVGVSGDPRARPRPTAMPTDGASPRALEEPPEEPPDEQGHSDEQT